MLFSPLYLNGGQCLNGWLISEDSLHHRGDNHVWFEPWLTYILKLMVDVQAFIGVLPEMSGSDLVALSAVLWP